jgi:hypothetical protein
LISRASEVLSITKNADGQGRFDDGVFTSFSASQPQHVSVKIEVTDQTKEAADIRLVTIDTTDVSTFTKV